MPIHADSRIDAARAAIAARLIAINLELTDPAIDWSTIAADFNWIADYANRTAIRIRAAATVVVHCTTVAELTLPGSPLTLCNIRPDRMAATSKIKSVTCPDCLAVLHAD